MLPVIKTQIKIYVFVDSHRELVQLKTFFLDFFSLQPLIESNLFWNLSLFLVVFSIRLDLVLFSFCFQNYVTDGQTNRVLCLLEMAFLSNIPLSWEERKHGQKLFEDNDK
uniref:Uncharacterized protein n=1 Tax=Micrurus spixii TaxID=129469 RepID=A0A2D4N2L9_9SAUR